MDYAKLNEFNLKELKNFARSVDIDVSNLDKKQLITELIKVLKIYEKYMTKQQSMYEKIQQLGKPGKDGITFLVKNKKEEFFAMKTFKKSKSSDAIILEGTLQKKAAKAGAAPSVYEINPIYNYIIMDKMDEHLIDIMKNQNGNLTKTQQNDVIRLFKKLDNSGIFHGDSNIMNYMYYDKKLYLIDYGMSKEICPKLTKKLGTDKPNINIMLLGFILKLKELNCPSSAYSYLIPYVNDSDRKKFNLN